MLTSQQNVANSSGLGVYCDDFDRIFALDNRSQKEKKEGFPRGWKTKVELIPFANANLPLPTIEKNC